MVQNFTSVDDLIKKNPNFVPNNTGTSRGAAKEVEPFPTSSEKFEIKEVVEHQPETEVKPYVEIKAESIELPPDLKKLGLQTTSSSSFPSYQNIKLPITDDKIVAGLNSPITSSLRWLATFALYLLQQAHLTLKVIHGKVVRVVKT
ncbi:hypothetical protein A2866_05740 [Candidatus Roizmanbacteria bacterium RIFCSPHIGHO2_01_FULL_39_8]|uniref:Uncharacterized protein n=1 Tax=Candidatus Roizmanbacteria bacterium RIFCSPHIGHO2_01_FULL_39_8 TaxID=1802033 RepID=A0A1F7GK76_9BACT|nr:MAG: hypothetical protein A2866_05740 [Candidatus Roizmanbacteria bacterium RIFCSPHIGHO2_01_FULL_39_8]